VLTIWTARGSTTTRGPLVRAFDVKRRPGPPVPRTTGQLVMDRAPDGPAPKPEHRATAAVHGPCRWSKVAYTSNLHPSSPPRSSLDLVELGSVVFKTRGAATTGVDREAGPR